MNSSGNKRVFIDNKELYDLNYIEQTKNML